MKTAPQALINLINSGAYTAFDLYTIDTVGTGQILLTAADIDIASGGKTWSADGVRIGSDSKAHWKTGLDVDQWQLTIYPRRRDEVTGLDYPDKIGVVPWLQAASAGVFDGAKVTIQRAFFADVPKWPPAPGGAVPVGLLTLFVGTVAECDVNTTLCVLTINDARYILNTQMPKNLYQASCRHRLFDVNCKVSALAYRKMATVGAGSTRTKIISAVPAPGTSKSYTLGGVSVKSGSNNGFRRTITSWDGGQVFLLSAPVPFDFALGDSLEFYPGCGKTMQDCSAGFSNLPNYGGNPFIPIPETTG